MFDRKSDKSPPPDVQHDVKLAVWTTKEEQTEEDSTTELVEVGGGEDEIPGKAEIQRESGEILGNGSSQIEVLGQLFPGRSRGSLEAALRESGGDLVKALEKCARFADGYTCGIQLYTLWGIHSVMMFCKAFLTCSSGRWADTAAIVHPHWLPELPTENKIKNHD